MSIDIDKLDELDSIAHHLLGIEWPDIRQEILELRESVRVKDAEIERLRAQVVAVSGLIDRYRDPDEDETVEEALKEKTDA